MARLWGGPDMPPPIEALLIGWIRRFGATAVLGSQMPPRTLIRLAYAQDFIAARRARELHRNANRELDPGEWEDLNPYWAEQLSSAFLLALGIES